MRPDDSDAIWLKRALRLAARGWGRVQPNPMVGAIVLDAEGRLAAQGYHAEYGQAHAEVTALEVAGSAALGGTLYVTLEPCNHHGRTPPCTDAILSAGLARVVYGAADPNPTATGGAARLRAAGVQVVGPLIDDPVRRQNAIFFHAHEQQNTFVALKLAASSDGRIADSPGVRTPITGAAANRETLRLRAGFDAIMVGIGTVIADDPLLTARGDILPRTPPVRIVLDSSARLPVTSQLVRTIQEAPVWLFCGRAADSSRIAELTRRGVRVFQIADAPDGMALPEVLDTLWQTGIKSVFCEGGAQVAGGLARIGRIDRFYHFVASRVIGTAGLGGFDAFPPGSLAHLTLSNTRRFGLDVLRTYDRAGSAHAREALEREGVVHGLG